MMVWSKGQENLYYKRQRVCRSVWNNFLTKIFHKDSLKLITDNQIFIAYIMLALNKIISWIKNLLFLTKYWLITLCIKFILKYALHPYRNSMYLIQILCKHLWYNLILNNDYFPYFLTLRVQCTLFLKHKVGKIDNYLETQ